MSRARGLEQEWLGPLLVEELASLVVRRARLDIPWEQWKVLPRGHASVLWALAEASELIARGHLRRALVLGLDSLVGRPVLEWLFLSRRLKTPEHPVGLMPGEAAAALLVERETDARRRGARIDSFVTALSTGGDTCQGLRLAATLERTLARATRVGDVYGDLNGEEARAREWGNFLARQPAGSALAGARHHWPAESLGDTGAASGAISLAAGVRSFVRGYARENEILVWSRSESGEVASGLLLRP
ncbi:hypothetical protein [Archangium sp.]|uniref:hypothetical protein n=1 Tax=Archangium sp. TaxID=1872627 RepID=UPI002D57DCFA|nr:hypothetical protein [Archangium sp.]HYO59981.1 hypothetical protein [Archangium sp.]